jgi:polyphosphate kinase
LNNRVEVLFPIESLSMQHAIFEDLLKPLLADNVNAHELRADGSYVLLQPGSEEQPFDCQDWFIEHPLFDVDGDGHAPDTTTSAIPSSV